jgi:hypothetical protein
MDSSSIQDDPDATRFLDGVAIEMADYSLEM